MILRHYSMALSVEPKRISDFCWAYPLYAELLRRVDPAYADALHGEGIKPISHYLRRSGTNVFWEISLFGEQAIAQFGAALAQMQRVELHKFGITLTLTAACPPQEKTGLQLLQQAEQMPDGGATRLALVTPVCFRANGRYVPLPTVELMLQSLVKSWNARFPDLPIEDEDGMGMISVAQGVRIAEFALHTEHYRLKNAFAPGALGEMMLSSSLKGFHSTLWQLMLLWAPYAGIGMKTSLGMGGCCLQ